MPSEPEKLVKVPHSWTTSRSLEEKQALAIGARKAAAATPDTARERVSLRMGASG
jgi:hypothetical protein